MLTKTRVARVDRLARLAAISHPLFDQGGLCVGDVVRETEDASVVVVPSIETNVVGPRLAIDEREEREEGEGTEGAGLCESHPLAGCFRLEAGRAKGSGAWVG